jgi:hypothetical protein
MRHGCLQVSFCDGENKKLVRPYERVLQQEAVIGIVYAVSASLGVLALDRAPQGAEHIRSSTRV